MGASHKKLLCKAELWAVELRTDMHTQRLVHEVETLLEVAIPKKAMNQFRMPPLRPLQKKRVHVGGPLPTP